MEPLDRIGNFEIVSEIGRGGMGAVYKAVRTTDHRTVALKVLPERFLSDAQRVERFHRETQAVSLLDHPNIVHIVEKGQSGDRLYFAMEYVGGTSLQAVLKQRRLSVPEALGVLKQVGQGLEYAHRKNIVHRDLSPGNILVSADLSVVKLADFGLCRVEEISQAEGTLPTMLASKGSMHYLAPEQAADGTSDVRSDIYSLGVLFYEMLTGRIPVGRFNLPSQLNSEVPPEFDPIVLKCLESGPENRYQTVGKLLSAVKKVEAALHLGLGRELQGISRSTTDIFKRSTSTLGRKLAVGVVVVLVLAAGAVAALFWLDAWPGSSDRAAPQVDEASSQASTPAPPPSAGESEPAAAPVVKPKPAAPPALPPAAAENAGVSRELDTAKQEIEAGHYAAALDELKAFVANHPDSALASRAYFSMAEIHDKQNHSGEALTAYREALQRYPGDAAAPHAKYRLAELTQQAQPDQPQAAAGLFAGVASDYPDSPYAAKALAKEANIELETKVRQLEPGMGNIYKALLTYRTLTQRHPDDPVSEEAYSKLADLYSDLHRYEQAAECYWNQGTHFPKNAYDAWWNAGETYEKKVKDKEKARQAYLRVPSTSRHYDDAQKRAAKLEKD